MTCSHPIPVTSPGPVPAIRYVLCEQERYHDRHEESMGFDGVDRAWYSCAIHGPWGDNAYLYGDNAEARMRDVLREHRESGKAHRHVEPDGTVREA